VIAMGAQENPMKDHDIAYGLDPVKIPKEWLAEPFSLRTIRMYAMVTHNN